MLKSFPMLVARPFAVPVWSGSHGDSLSSVAMGVVFCVSAPPPPRPPRPPAAAVVCTGSAPAPAFNTGDRRVGVAEGRELLRALVGHGFVGRTAGGAAPATSAATACAGVGHRAAAVRPEDDVVLRPQVALPEEILAEVLVGNAVGVERR